jgi:D-alanyl-D-alanine carboxypeptidase
VIERSIGKSDSLIRNHNKLLQRYPGADGIKTGYVRQSGKCLVASATREEDGHPWRLIAVVLNSPNTYTDSAALLNYGFKRFRQVFIAAKGEKIASANVKWGKPGEIAAVAAADVVAIVPREGEHRVEPVVSLSESQAPIKTNSQVGTVTVTIDGQPAGDVALVNGRPAPAVPLLAAEAVHKNWLALGTRMVSAPLGLMLFVGLAPRYARALAKGPRRRRRRVPARRRSYDPGRPRGSRRPARHHAWDES